MYQLKLLKNLYRRIEYQIKIIGQQEIRSLWVWTQCVVIFLKHCDTNNLKAVTNEWYIVDSTDYPTEILNLCFVDFATSISAARSNLSTQRRIQKLNSSIFLIVKTVSGFNEAWEFYINAEGVCVQNESCNLEEKNDLQEVQHVIKTNGHIWEVWILRAKKQRKMYNMASVNKLLHLVTSGRLIMWKADV